MTPQTENLNVPVGDVIGHTSPAASTLVRTQKDGFLASGGHAGGNRLTDGVRVARFRTGRGWYG